MFGLDWSELALIAVVALVVIGPKDLPDAVRGLATGVRKLRRMAGDFQQQADELVKEANLQEVRQHIQDIRSFNIRDEVERHVDGDGSIRRTFNDDPFRPGTTPTAATQGGPGGDAAAAPPDGAASEARVPVAEAPAPAWIPPAEAAAVQPRDAAAPAWIPPADAALADTRVAAAEAPAPAWIPPAEAAAAAPHGSAAPSDPSRTR